MNCNVKIFHLGVLSAACAVLLATTTDIAAQTASHCGPRDTVVSRLAQGYGETRKSIGLGANNAVIEMFASEETGTWTITATSTSGVTCLIASGQAFEAVVEALPAKGSDA